MAPPAKGVAQTMFLGLMFFFVPPVFLVPFLPLLYFSPKYYHQFATFGLVWFYAQVSAVLELLGGCKYVFSGDTPPSRSDAGLWISNHRTRTDWLYSWSYMLRWVGLYSVKQAPKWDLRALPGVGWAIQMCVFFFFKRAGHWDEDKRMITERLAWFKLAEVRPSIMLFPEGTDLTANTKKRSDEFAAKNNLPEYSFCLHPRSTGFTYMLEQMRPNIDAVYDVTIAYGGNIPQSELHLVNNKFPSECHIHVRRFDVKDMPKDDKALAEWISERWAEKEARLKAFYTKGSKSFNRLAPPLPESQVPSVAHLHFGGLLLSAVFLPTALYGMVMWPWYRYYNIAYWVGSWALTKYHIGLDQAMVRYSLSHAARRD